MSREQDARDAGSIAIGTRVYVRERSKRQSSAYPGEHIIIAGPRMADYGSGNWTEYVGVPCYPEDELFDSTGSSAQNLLRSIDADTIDMIEDERKREITDEMVAVACNALFAFGDAQVPTHWRVVGDDPNEAMRRALMAALEAPHG